MQRVDGDQILGSRGVELPIEMDGVRDGWRPQYLRSVGSMVATNQAETSLHLMGNVESASYDDSYEDEDRSSGNDDEHSPVGKLWMKKVKCPCHHH